MDDKVKFKKIATLVFSAIVLAWALFNLQTVKDFLDFIVLIAMPFIIGTFVALLLNIPMKFFEKKFTKKNKKGEVKTRRGLALALSIICILLLIVLVIVLIIPELVNVANIFIEHIPFFQEKLVELVNQIQTIYPDLNLENIRNAITSNLENIGGQLVEQAPVLITSSFGFITTAFMTVINFFIGIGFAFLVLLNKESLSKQAKQIMITYLKEQRTEKILKFLNIFVNAFNRTVVAQCIIAVMLGGVCIVGSLLMQIPYAVPIGVLVGFTSLVPVIGTVIGIIIGAILIVAVDPIKALIFLIFAIVIWQVEENFIRPKIVGKRVGLPEIWLFVATIIGIAVLGIIGIFISIPLFTALYVLIMERISSE